MNYFIRLLIHSCVLVPPMSSVTILYYWFPPCLSTQCTEAARECKCRVALDLLNLRPGPDAAQHSILLIGSYNIPLKSITARHPSARHNFAMAATKQRSGPSPPVNLVAETSKVHGPMSLSSLRPSQFSDKVLLPSYNVDTHMPLHRFCSLHHLDI